jgi:hypothetical protein
MRYLKSYKLFEGVDVKDIESFKELFYNFSDDGFEVETKTSSAQKLDFSKKDSLTSFEIPDYKPGKTIVITTIDVKVSRPNFKSFNIDEVKENLLFAQSYAKDELGLKIEYIYIVRNWEYIYYKSIDVLPSNIMIDSVTISFTNM